MSQLMQSFRMDEERKSGWQWPLNLAEYDRTPFLSSAEKTELETIMLQRKLGGYRPYQTAIALQRLFRPLHDVLDWVGAPPSLLGTRQAVLSVITQEMYHRRTSFWAWTEETWKEILCLNSLTFQQRYRTPWDTRQMLLATSYLIGNFTDLHSTGHLLQI